MPGVASSPAEKGIEREVSPPDCNCNGQRGGIIFKMFALMILVAVVGGLFLARFTILRAAGNYWVVDQKPDYADVIIVQGDTFYSERATKAAELYHAGWASRIIAGGFLFRPHASTADFIAKDLEERGVAEKDIIIVPLRETDTRGQAQELAEYMQQQRWHRVLWVTGNYHTRRAEYICEHVFPANIEFRMIAAPDSRYDPNTWWKSRVGAKLFFHECVGMLAAMWEFRFTPRTSGTNWGALIFARAAAALSNPPSNAGLLPRMAVL